MIRRHDREDVGFIPFADLAMAVLGPVAGLMIIFLVIVGTISGPECERPGPEEKERLRQEVERWLKGRRAATEVDRRAVEAQCPDLESPGAPLRLYDFVPEPMHGVCRSDVAEILETVPEDLLHVEQRHHAALSAARACLGMWPEVIEVPSEELEFMDCSLDFQRPGTTQQLPGREVDAFFDQLAAKLADRLRQRNFNRIDIFGHSDSRPVRSKCAAVRDNARLSSLRAHRFRDALVDAFKRGGFGDVVQRITSRELRIYAIGVGAAEPKVPGVMTLDQHAKNRRIELRLVRDFPRGPKP